MSTTLVDFKNISGTVAASFADMDFVRRREGIEELFEDGTISFLSIASIRHGFKILNSLTPSMMSRYVKFVRILWIYCTLLNGKTCDLTIAYVGYCLLEEFIEKTF